LRSHIRGRVLGIFNSGPAGWFPRIVHREMANPTAMAPGLRKQFLQPRIKELESVVRTVLGEKATELDVRCCALNILSLYAFLNIGRRARRRLFGGRRPTEAQLDAVIRQIQEFAVAAVAGVRAAARRRHQK
jgi:hypothetical protein